MRCACCTDDEIAAVFDFAEQFGGRYATVAYKVPPAKGGLHCAKNLEAVTTDQARKRKTPMLQRTLSLIEAAAFLQMSPLTLRKKAAAGTVPASKPGKSWVFELDELKDFLKAHRKCPSIAAPTLRITGSAFNLTAGKSGSALAQRIAAQRKSLRHTREAMHGAK